MTGTRAKRRPTAAERALVDVRQEVLEAVATLAKQVKALAAEGRRREVRLRTVEEKTVAQDRLLIGLNASVHTFQRHLEKVVKEEAKETRKQLGDFVRTAVSEYTSVAARVAVLEEARYADAMGGAPTNGKGGDPLPP